jgi:GTP cyclohydrolase I
MSIDRKAAASAIEAFLRAIGRDPAREPELASTGARVTDAFVDELCDGYEVNVAALLRENRVPGTTSIVVVRDAPFTTMCPHHLLPATGRATVAFAPGESLVGIGTLVKLVDAFAHRLALQESIGEEVCAALMEQLQPRWAGCRLIMEHACLVARGERRHGARVETIALRGEPDEATRMLAHRALGVGA